MKNLKISLFTIGLFFVLASSAKAMEGTAILNSKDGKMGSCFAASVYYEGRYRILMTCKGLVSALDPVNNKYVAWAKEGENFKKLSEIVSGKMQASMTQAFSGIVITAEESRNVNKPSGEFLLTGDMESIVLDSGQAPAERDSGRMTTNGDEVVVAPTSTPTPTPTPTPVVEETKGATSNVFKIIGKALLTGFVVLLLIVGVLSYVSRRRKN